MNKIINNIVFEEGYISQIIYDALKNEARIVIKQLMRSGDNNCEFGFDESLCLDEGVLVFTEVEKMFFDSNGVLPHDLEKIEYEQIDNNLYKFTFFAYTQEENPFRYINSIFNIIAKDVYLIDTKNPNIKITE